MKEEEINALISALFSKTIQRTALTLGRSYDVNIIAEEGRVIVESIIRQHLLNANTAKITELETRMKIYEQIIAKSNFATIIESES